MSGSSSGGGSYTAAYNNDDPNLKAYVTKTTEGQQFSDLYKQLGAKGQDIYQINGKYTAITPGQHGLGDYDMANPAVDQFIGSYLKWQQTQKASDQAWDSYAKIQAEEQGRGQTILTGAAQTQYSSILASLGNPAQTPARPRNGAMGAPT